jgi:hypothetical protein
VRALSVVRLNTFLELYSPCSLFYSSRSFVYYESIKRELKIKPMYECRCDVRLQTKRFTCLSYTGLVVELEHLKIKTRLTNEKFVSVKGYSWRCGLVVYYKSKSRVKESI